MLDSNAPSYIVFVVLEILTVINCIITLKLNIRLRINNCLNKNNINHEQSPNQAAHAEYAYLPANTVVQIQGARYTLAGNAGASEAYIYNKEKY